MELLPPSSTTGSRISFKTASKNCLSTIMTTGSTRCDRKIPPRRLLDEVARLLDPVRAKIAREHHVDPHIPRPARKFVDADPVYLFRPLGELEPLGANPPSV